MATADNISISRRSNFEAAGSLNDSSEFSGQDKYVFRAVGEKGFRSVLPIRRAYFVDVMVRIEKIFNTFALGSAGAKGGIALNLQKHRRPVTPDGPCSGHDG